ncbi:MAG: FtsX-like permease family protein [Reichenbachiella sp.]|uniref:FtsX-like permease family protein n=1 Tax=Reichenbachiella sp. TaxID=2184521 RepID=UPI0032648B4E
MSEYKPPTWANRLLEKICPDDLLEEIQGDLFEAFEWRSEIKSLRYARRKFCLEVFMVLIFYKPNLMKTPRPSLLKNYLVTGLRNLQKNKSYVIINTFGLGIALACCVSAYLFVAYNIEFDDFHADSKVNKIYSIHSHLLKTERGTYECISAPINLAPNAAADLSGIKRFTRFNNEQGYVRYGDHTFNESISFADSSFFDMFDFPLIQGSHESFKNMHSVFISQKMAEKYFRDENPIGKVLLMNFPNQTEIQAVVGGVLKKVPTNSTFVFDMLLREEHFMEIHALGADDWKDWQDPSTYFELTSHDQASVINEQFDKYIKRRNKERTDRVVLSYKLEHFKANFGQDDVRWSQVNLRMSIIPLIVFMTMALMILLIACFNMTNTSIAMTARRMKEVGIRKVIGASKWQVVTQFLLETVLVTVGSLFVGIAMSYIIVPVFADMWELNYGLEDLSGLNMFLTLLFLIFFTSLLAGIYPALFSSKFRPVVLLKGGVKIKGSNLLTRGLISVQFALSVIVLIAGVIFIQNTNFQEQVNFGYDKDMVFLVNVKSQKQYEVIENRLKNNTKILEVGGTAHSLGRFNYQAPVIVDTAHHEVWHYGIGKNYFDVMGLEIAEGRDLNLESTTDLEGSVVVNKAFLKKIQMSDPLMKVISVHEVKRRIVGVVEDHIDNLFVSNEPEPSVFYPATPQQYHYLLVRANSDNLLSLKNDIEEIWKSEFPDIPFQLHFQEDLLFNEIRNVNANLKTIFLFLTFLGGMLSASGIFSLATLNTEKRSKEIGIRKALGASIQNIMTLMNKEFVIVLTIAGFLGALGGYFLIGILLDEIYAYHIPVSAISVVLCALLIFIIGLSTTSITILKGAKANPVDTLRTE